MKKQKLILSIMSLLFLSTLSFNNTTSAIVNSSNNDVQATKTTTQDASLSVAIADSGGGSSTITFGDYKIVATTTSNLNSYGGLTVYTSKNNVVYTSASWLVGFIGHSYETKITKITQVNGVFSHLQLISRELLLTGSSLSSLSSYTYTASAEEAMYFYTSVDGKIEASLYSSATFGGTVSASTSVNTSVSWKAVKTEYYTRKTVQENQYTVFTSLNSSSAEYCPTGYAMTVGQHGTYYIVEAEAQIYQNWWWNSHKAYGDPIDVSFIICDVTKLSSDYVYKKDTGSSTLYYLD